MSFYTKCFYLFAALILGISPLKSFNLYATGSVTLYTPYTKISVPPGESIDYSIDVINNSSELQNVEIALDGMPRGWEYSLKSGGWNVSQLSVLPGERKSLSLKVDVPLQVNKGNYRFRMIAKGLCTLQLVVNVSEQGTYKTEFSTTQPNMEGHAGSTFTFSATLKNRTADTQLYALKANTDRGWNVTFKANYKAVTSVGIDANKTENITVEVVPPDQIEAGKYKIPVIAETGTTSANLDLEVVITGSYKMDLTTPTGLLSANITAGDTRRIALLVKNTGSSELKDINLDFSAPVNWDVTFEPKKIPLLESKGSTQVYATIKADKKAIPGDYEAVITAKTPEVSAKTTFRISVKTSILWGWMGIFIIIIAAGSVYYLFRKYGRR